MSNIELKAVIDDVLCPGKQTGENEDVLAKGWL